MSNIKLFRNSNIGHLPSEEDLEYMDNGQNDGMHNDEFLDSSDRESIEDEEWEQPFHSRYSGAQEDSDSSE